MSAAKRFKNNFALAATLSILALSLAGPARAFEVAPFFGQNFGGSFVDANTGDSFDVADSNAFGLIFDFDTEPDKQIEILLSRQNSYLSTGDPLFTPNPLFDLTIDYYQLGGLYMIPADELPEQVRPFVSGAFGLTRMVPKQTGLSAENRLSVSLGTGAKIFFNKSLGIRFDLRGIYTALNSDTAIFCSGGCTIKINSSGFFQTELSAALMMRF
jgi:hypothetical protein